MLQVTEDKDTDNNAELKRQRTLEELEKELTRLPEGPGLMDDINKSKDQKDKVAEKVSKKVTGKLTEKDSIEGSRPEQTPAMESLSISSENTDKSSQEASVTDPEIILSGSSQSASSLPKEQFTSSHPAVETIGSSEAPSVSQVSQPAATESTPDPVMPKSKPKDIYKTVDSSSEDFYSQYKCLSPESPVGMSIEDAIHSERPAEEAKEMTEKESSLDMDKDDPAFSGIV